MSIHRPQLERAWCPLILAACTTAAQAQASSLPAEHEPTPTVQERILLRQRGRSVMHPSDPLALSGLEQNGNDMRAGTPALQRGSTTPTTRQEDEAYLRAIAMVETRAVFHTPPKRSDTAFRPTIATHPGEAAGSHRTRGDQQDTATTGPSAGLTLGAVGAAVLAIVMWTITHRRA